jgi:PhnB protein
MNGGRIEPFAFRDSMPEAFNRSVRVGVKGALSASGCSGSSRSGEDGAKWAPIRHYQLRREERFGHSHRLHRLGQDGHDYQAWSLGSLIHVVDRWKVRSLKSHCLASIIYEVLQDNHKFGRGGQMHGSSSPVPTSIAATLSVRHGREAVAFYQAAFGAEVRHRVEDASGAVVAQLSVSGAEFWVADESPAHQNFSPATLGGCSVRMLLITADPDAMCHRAVAAGAIQVVPVGDEHGWRLGRIQDPFGHHWEVGRPPLHHG